MCYILLPYSSWTSQITTQECGSEGKSNPYESSSVLLTLASYHFFVPVFVPHPVDFHSCISKFCLHPPSTTSHSLDTPYTK